MLTFKKKLIYLSIIVPAIYLIYHHISFTDSFILNKNLKTLISDSYNHILNEYKNVTLISNITKVDKIFVALEKLNINITIIDIRTYIPEHKYYKTIYHSTDNGVMFTADRLTLKNIQEFLYTRDLSTVILTDQGYLYLNKIIFDNDFYFYMKLKIKRIKKYTGLLFDFQETQSFANLLDIINFNNDNKSIY